MAFPRRIQVSLVNPEGKSILIGRIAFLGHLFAHYRNDYYVGPYWTDDEGTFEISREEVEEDIRADQGLCGMDYASSLDQCKPVFELELLDQKGIEGLTKGTTTWGLVGPEKKKWKTPEEKIAFIHQNNNSLVHPEKIQIDLSTLNPTDAIQHKFVTDVVNPIRSERDR